MDEFNARLDETNKGSKLLVSLSKYLSMNVWSRFLCNGSLGRRRWLPPPTKADANTQIAST